MSDSKNEALGEVARTIFFALLSEAVCMGRELQYPNKKSASPLTLARSRAILAKKHLSLILSAYCRC